MAYEACKEIGEWVEEQVWQPVDRQIDVWTENCNPWLCWPVLVAEWVTEWILIPVLTWVGHTVCEIIATVVDLFVDVVFGAFDVIVGLFTLDFPRVWDGLVRIFLEGIVEAFFSIFRIVTFGDTLRLIAERFHRDRLREHVKRLLEAKYSGAELQAMKDAIGVDYGAFGLRIRANPVRLFLRSDFRTDPNGDPELLKWHEDPNLAVDIRQLAGLRWNDFSQRFRPQIVPDAGTVGEREIDEYIASRGTIGPGFCIFPMDNAVFEHKMRTASEKSRVLGLLLRWQPIEDIRIEKAEHVLIGDSADAVVRLGLGLGRTNFSTDPDGARAEICRIPFIAAFGYANGTGVARRKGIGPPLMASKCGLDAHDTGVVTFRDLLPDAVWRYVPVHEMGHYFGLCHVDGLDRIMVSTETNSPWSGWLIPDYVYLTGGPTFTHEEALAVWNYIVEHVPPQCLTTRAT